MSRRRLLYGTSTPEPEPNWIAASGMAYIDLGVTPTNKSGIRITFDVNDGYDNYQGRCLCGVESSAHQNTFDAMYFRTNGDCRMEWGSSYGSDPLPVFYPESVYEWRHEANTAMLLKDNTVLIAYEFSQVSFTCWSTLQLFRMNLKNSYSYSYWNHCPRVRKIMYTDDCTVENPIWNTFTPYHFSSLGTYGLIDTINYRFYGIAAGMDGQIIGHVE